MRISIMQPGYLPWLGFFELMYNSDLFVIFDDVQYTKKDWRSRNRIRTSAGWAWLSVPVKTKGKRFQLISEAKIDHSSDWRRKHLAAIEINYQKAAYFKEYFPQFSKILSSSQERLIDLDLALIKWMSGELGVFKDIVKSSSLATSGEREEKIAAICSVLGADELYDTKASSEFLDRDYFLKAGIKLIFQDYQHPGYRQVYSPFIPYMSAIDLLFNHGPESRRILLNGSAVY